MNRTICEAQCERYANDQRGKVVAVAAHKSFSTSNLTGSLGLLESEIQRKLSYQKITITDLMKIAEAVGVSWKSALHSRTVRQYNE